MNIEAVLAGKYAQAFLNVEGDQLTPAVFKALQEFEHMLSQHQSALFFLSVPSITDERKTQIVIHQASSPALKKMLIPLIQLLIEHKRGYYLSAVVRKIIQLYWERHGIMLFTITSAHELESKQVKQLEAFLARKTSHTIEYNVKLDKNLIAGIRMQSSTYLWEYSVRKQLAAINYLMIR